MPRERSEIVSSKQASAPARSRIDRASPRKRPCTHGRIAAPTGECADRSRLDRAWLFRLSWDGLTPLDRLQAPPADDAKTPEPTTDEELRGAFESARKRSKTAKTETTDKTTKTETTDKTTKTETTDKTETTKTAKTPPATGGAKEEEDAAMEPEDAPTQPVVVVVVDTPEAQRAAEAAFTDEAERESVMARLTRQHSVGFPSGGVVEPRSTSPPLTDKEADELVAEMEPADPLHAEILGGIVRGEYAVGRLVARNGMELLVKRLALIEAKPTRAELERVALAGARATHVDYLNAEFEFPDRVMRNTLSSQLRGKRGADDMVWAIVQAKPPQADARTDPSDEDAKSLTELFCGMLSHPYAEYMGIASKTLRDHYRGVEFELALVAASRSIHETTEFARRFAYDLNELQCQHLAVAAAGEATQRYRRPRRRTDRWLDACLECGIAQSMANVIRLDAAERFAEHKGRLANVYAHHGNEEARAEASREQAEAAAAAKELRLTGAGDDPFKTVCATGNVAHFAYLEVLAILENHRFRLYGRASEISGDGRAEIRAAAFDAAEHAYVAKGQTTFIHRPDYWAAVYAALHKADGAADLVVRENMLEVEDMIRERAGIYAALMEPTPSVEEAMAFAAAMTPRSMDAQAAEVVAAAAVEDELADAALHDLPPVVPAPDADAEADAEDYDPELDPELDNADFVRAKRHIQAICFIKPSATREIIRLMALDYKFKGVATPDTDPSGSAEEPAPASDSLDLEAMKEHMRTIWFLKGSTLVKILTLIAKPENVATTPEDYDPTAEPRDEPDADADADADEAEDAPTEMIDASRGGHAFKSVRRGRSGSEAVSSGGRSGSVAVSGGRTPSFCP